MRGLRLKDTKYYQSDHGRRKRHEHKRKMFPYPVGLDTLVFFIKESDMIFDRDCDYIADQVYSDCYLCYRYDICKKCADEEKEKSMEIRPCPCNGGWQYCNGNCSECGNLVYTDHTTQSKEKQP